MAGFGNEIVYADGFKLTPTSVDSLSRMQSAPTDVASINYTGNPEGFVSANPSSLCHDPVSGDIYAKITGSGNTGWSNINSSSGDVVGPASSADNDIAVFDGLTGKIIKDTGISSIAPTFTGDVSTLSKFGAPFDTGAGEGYYFSDGTPALREIGIARANYFFGNSGNSSMSGIANTGGGQAALVSLTSGIQNTGMGNGALAILSSGGGNSAYGYFSLFNQVTGSLNSGLGWASLQGTGNFSYCTAVGAQALLSNAGDNNTAVGRQALTSNTTGTENTSVGVSSLSGVTTGVRNIGLGSGAGAGITTGTNNIAIGYLACRDTGSSSHNIGIGFVTLANCTGSNNVAIGYQSLANIVAGTGNIAAGYNAGSSLTTTDSNNILIGNSGSSGDNSKILIGQNGTHTTCFIQGISGVTVPASTAVLIDANGQMGTILSSERYKENIVDMPKDISVMNLRPVQFTYKTNNENEVNNLSYGLIAEEVDQVFPYLCVYKDGQPETVKYHELCVFLLAEIQKLEKRLLIIERKDS